MADIDETDPIKASYDVFIKPPMSGSRQVYILQFPNRDSKHKYAASNNSQPLKMRVKPNAGMVELDVPMDVWHNYDRDKGVKWGGAMKKSKANHGLPGGFGIGGTNVAGRGRGRGPVDTDAEHKRLLDDFASAVDDEQVLLKQTLGGQTIPMEETTPQYMIGTFYNNQLHLTPVDNIVQMRPQFHHVDAQADQERSIRRDGTMPARATEARAIHMTVKSNIDGEEESSENMAQRIITAQQEQWKSHTFIDEEDPGAWDAYNVSLFVGGVAGTVGENVRHLEVDELMAKYPTLKSNLDDPEYLDTISAPRDASKLSRAKKTTKSKKGKEVEVAAVDLVDSDSSTLSDTSEEEEDEREGGGDVTLS